MEMEAVTVALAPANLTFFVDRRLPAGVRPSLEEARRRLSDERCAGVLSEFTDPEGRRLDEKVASLGHTAASYLSLVIFYDGRSTEECGFRSTLAWTNPGSRVVQVCWNQFRQQQHLHPGYTANTIIHEMLHTLGLGETPPAPREITARVAARCGD
jgi:hypothetical protein